MIVVADPLALRSKYCSPPTRWAIADKCCFEKMQAVEKKLVGALITRDGRLLLGLRSARKSTAPETWDVIGGHVEQRETFEAALRRELDEEVGIEPVEFYEHSRHAHEEFGTLVLFHVSRWTHGEPRLCNDEHVELRWFTIDEACRLPNLAASEYVPVFRSLEVGGHGR